MILTWLSKYRDAGILFLRIGLGAAFILHGWPKIEGGPETWIKIGSAMKFIGVDFLPVFWGFMAAISETLGGVLIILGFLFRPAAFLLTFTMTIAAVMLYHTTGANFTEWSRPAEMAVIFFSLILIGAGRFSIDRA